MKKICDLLKKPGKGFLAVLYPITAVLIVISTVLALRSQGYVNFIIYAFAATSLGYTTYTLVIYRHKIKKGASALVRSGKFTRELIDSFGFRTFVGGLVSFSLSVLYGIFNGIMGLMVRSVWYGSLAAYYIFLTVIRGGVLLRYKKYDSAFQLKNAKVYLKSGILLLLMNVALSVAIAQMIFEGKGFVYSGIMIYASALYTFVKIGMAINNFVKAHKQSDIVTEAIRNISLVDGAVSILALQTAMLWAFSKGKINNSLMNTLTGSFVSILTYSVAILMIIKGFKEIKRIKSENINEQK